MNNFVEYVEMVLTIKIPRFPNSKISSFLENFIFALLILLSEFFRQIGGTLKFTFSSFLENTFW